LVGRVDGDAIGPDVNGSDLDAVFSDGVQCPPKLDIGNKASARSHPSISSAIALRLADVRASAGVAA
jgi:hypothetical protein